MSSRASSKNNNSSGNINSHRFNSDRTIQSHRNENSRSSSSKTNLATSSTKDSSCKPKAASDKNANTSSPDMAFEVLDDDPIDDDPNKVSGVGELLCSLESDLADERSENQRQANSKSTITNASSSTTNTTPPSAPASSSSPLTSSRIASYIADTPYGSSNNHHTAPRPSNQKSQKHASANYNQYHLSQSNAANSTSSNLPGFNNGHNSLAGNGLSAASSSRTVFKTSADGANELKMRITRETKPGKSEHKIVTSPNQKSPTSCSSSSAIISQASAGRNSENVYMQDSSSNNPTQSTSGISSTRECGTSTSIGTITEPDCLGPCEPGTSVNLEGIVWQETDGGILVVNVTWRGKTYVGALLDCTKHDWAPPRLCDSPTSDIDSKTHKGVRTKRIVTRSNGIGLDDKNLLQTTGKLRNGKGRRIPPTNDPGSCKKAREGDKTSNGSDAVAQLEANTSAPASSDAAVGTLMNVDVPLAMSEESTTTSSKSSSDRYRPESPTLIGCTEPNCSKKYRNMNGLLYHQAHAHPNDNESTPANERPSSCPSPKEDKVKGEAEQPVQKSDQSMQHESSNSLMDKSKPSTSENKSNSTISDRRNTPSPKLSFKLDNRLSNDPPTFNPNLGPLEPRMTVIRSALDSERRSHLGPNPDQPMMMDFGPRLGGLQHRPMVEPPLSIPFNHSNAPKSSPGSNSKPPGQAPLPTTTEEGMKPSGTSTGPPPAPHQANCYFNSAFMTNAYNPPYGFPPAFFRQMFDPLAPPVPVSGANFLNRFMGNPRVPPPSDSPSRLLSPSSLPGNIPSMFPPFKLPPPPGTQLPNTVPPPILGPIPGMPPIPSSAPFLRMPSQGDPMLPPE